MKNLLVILALLAPISGNANVPKVVLTYAQMFDFVCAKKTNYKVDPSWIDELRNSLQ